MIALYARIPEKQIRKEAATTIKQIEKWFKNNPKRRTCTAELWYGRTKSIRRGHVTEDINAAAEEALGNKKGAKAKF